MNYTEAQLAEIMEVGMDEYTGAWGESTVVITRTEAAYITVEDCNLIGGMQDIAECIKDEFNSVDIEIQNPTDYYFTLWIQNIEQSDIKEVCNSIVSFLIDNKVEKFTLTVLEQDVYE